MNKRPAEEDGNGTCGPCMRGSAKKSKVEKKYDSDHNDPSAKLVFETNDGVLFRVHEWYFKKARYVTLNLLVIPQVDNEAVPCSQHVCCGKQRHRRYPMSANLSASALRAILPFIYLKDFKMTRGRLDTITVADLYAINEFAGFYDLDEDFGESIEQTIRDRAEISPHLLFAEASKRRDQTMAKHALAFFKNKAGVKDRVDIDQSRFADFADVEPRYLFELLRLRGSRRFLKKVSGEDPTGAEDIYQTDWNALSRAFDPRRQ